MLGGVGEAMLISAAVGGGSAALTGGDPLKGALIGAATGGVGAGISGLAAGSGGLSGLLGTGATTATTAATAAETALAPELVNAGMQASGAAAGATPTGIAGLQNIAGPGSLDLANLANPAANASAGINMAPGAEAGFRVGPLAPEAAAAKSVPSLFTDPTAYLKANALPLAGVGVAGALGGRQPIEPIDTAYTGPLSRFRYNPESYVPGGGGEEARKKRFGFGFADGGIAALPGYDKMVGETPLYPRAMASGGVSDLGSYSDGGRMLKGAGDGMSDSIPGVIAGKRPARLADGEFVVPADVVSHLGNGSTDAGAKQLYAMMDKVRKARTGTKRQGREINPRRFMPA